MCTRYYVDYRSYCSSSVHGFALLSFPLCKNILHIHTWDSTPRALVQFGAERESCFIVPYRVAMKCASAKILRHFLRNSREVFYYFAWCTQWKGATKWKTKHENSNRATKSMVKRSVLSCKCTSKYAINWDHVARNKGKWWIKLRTSVCFYHFMFCMFRVFKLLELNTFCLLNEYNR